MIDIDQADPQNAVSAPASAVEKAVVPLVETSAAPLNNDNASSKPEQEKSWFQRRIDIEKGWIQEQDQSIGRLRKKVITALPNFVVNHSSNFTGAMQLVAEVLMVKSAGVNLKERAINGAIVEAKGINKILYPLYNVFVEPFKKSGVTKIKFDELLKPSFYKDKVLAFNNLERARVIDGRILEVPGIATANAINPTKLYNRFSVRSGVAGIVSMTVAMMFPDHKDTPEETDAAAKLQVEHPIGYIAKRSFQAVWFPFETVIQCVKKVFNPSEDQQIGIHKRQFAGLGMAVTGILSILSGFRQVNGKFTVVNGVNTVAQKYQRNSWHMAGGAITAFAGLQLMLGIDNQQGWSRFGLTQIARLLTLPGSIGSRFADNEQGAKWYAGAQAALQAKNVTAALIGGAEKSEDGTIVDHKAMREKAKTVALQVKADKPKRHSLLDAADEAPAQPVTKVTRAKEVALAMPERNSIAKAEQAKMVNA